MSMCMRAYTEEKAYWYSRCMNLILRILGNLERGLNSAVNESRQNGFLLLILFELIKTSQEFEALQGQSLHSFKRKGYFCLLQTGRIIFIINNLVIM